MAVMYSKLGGCLGETTKLGPLAGTDLCAGVKGLLDKLMTHIGLGSSIKRTLGIVVNPTVSGGRSVTSLRICSTSLGSSTVLLGGLGRLGSPLPK